MTFDPQVANFYLSLAMIFIAIVHLAGHLRNERKRKELEEWERMLSGPGKW